MESNRTNLQDFAESLYVCDDFRDAFTVLETAVERLGFSGVLYTYIPKALIESNFSQQPVYEVSTEFSQAYLDHYAEARFDKQDPMIKAVDSGEPNPINWWGESASHIVTADVAGLEVIETARDYGIHNGVTIPLMSGIRGIAGASFISDDQHKFQSLMTERLGELNVYTQMFHTLVQTNASYFGRFIKPWLANLNKTEHAFLIGLRDGKAPAQIALELNKSEGYLEQVMLRIRRKMSGVGPEDQPLINRNQVMYYFGLMSILENPDPRRR